MVLLVKLNQTQFLKIQVGNPPSSWTFMTNFIEYLKPSTLNLSGLFIIKNLQSWKY